MTIRSPNGQPLGAWARVAIAFVGLLVGAFIVVVGIGMLSSGEPSTDPTTVTTRVPPPSTGPTSSTAASPSTTAG